MCGVLDEILIIAKKALAIADDKVINIKVEEVSKGFISIGGSLDSIILLCEDKKNEPRMDNIDRKDRHNIAGGMNSPSPMQHRAFDEENIDG